MPCPSDTLVSLFAENILAEDARHAIELHVDRCPTCRQLVAGLARTEPARSVADGPLAGRYELIRVIGAGGMGVVYEAHDRVLDRRVAIKLLRGIGSGDARARLVREAQAMAKVSSPYVVGVYDVGEVGDQVFVSMELVAGVTLRDWLATRRDWRAIASVFERAGRGLAAAHACGIVHRDFKPENVLVDGDRVRVADFGLASSATLHGISSELVAAALDRPLTITGQIIGTPAYMAPEQLAGGLVDERTDQFAFCVALYEALFGARPFEGATFAALSASVLAGRIRPPGAIGPAWLRVAILRGLARDPEARHRSMSALLEILASARARRTRARILIAGTAAAVALAGAGVTLARSDAPAPCGGGGALAAEVWNAERARAIQRVLPAATAALVTKHLDAWNEQWQRTYRDTCEATRVHGVQSDDLLDLRMACLRGRATAATELLAVLEHADRRQLDDAISALPAVTNLAICRDRKSLLDPMRPPQDPEQLASYERARSELVRAETRRIAGDLETATTIARAVDAEGERLGHRALRARAQLVLGFGADLADQERRFDDARRLAEAAADDRTRVEAGLQLVQVWQARRKLELVDTLLADLDAVVARLESPADLAASLAYQRARTQLDRGEYAAARTELERAIDLQRRADGTDSLSVARVRGELALAVAQLGDIEAGITIATEVLATFERELGATHPWIADQSLTRGELARAANRPELARDDYQRAIEIYTRIHGPDSEVVARPLASLATVLAMMGKHADALATLDRAIPLFERHLGPDMADTAVAKSYRAQVRFDLGEIPRAEREYAEALAVIVKARGEDDAIVAELRATRGEKRAATGNVTGAIEDYAATLPVFESVLGADHPSVQAHVKTLAELKARRARP